MMEGTTLCIAILTQPRVAGRDVKPDNIVLGGGKAGGQVYLVDFGGVQAAALSQDYNSTIIGNTGRIHITSSPDFADSCLP